MKATLLELVQDILSNIDGDEVNSITDTFESEQVATILKNTFIAMSSNRDWPTHSDIIQIPSYGDVTKPTHMKLPDGVKRIKSLMYDKADLNDTRTMYREVKYISPDAFLRKTNLENSDLDEVDVVTDPSGVKLLIRNDTHPTYYTSFDDRTLVFNSYNSSVDSSLQESKTQALVDIMPVWQTSDDFIVDLPDVAFSAFFNEALSAASLRLRQTVDMKAEQEAKRQQNWLARKARKVNRGLSYPNYGRVTRK